MQSKRLPVAILSPHGGLGIPPELVNKIALTPEQIFNEADAYVDEMYDFRDKVLYYETFPYARCIIDLNRPRNKELHHREGDGIVKRVTSYGDEVFKKGERPDERMEAFLIDKYWGAWHKKLDEIANDNRVKLIIDAHSMAGRGPSNYENPYQIRPRLMVGNMGNHEGKPTARSGFVTADPQLTSWFADELGKSLAYLEPLSESGAISAVNDPYWGGWNIRAHGRSAHQAWLMVEISRAMYIGHQSANSPIIPMDEARIKAIRCGLWQVIEKAVKEKL